jgi:hypothetical protein
MLYYFFLFLKSFFTLKKIMKNDSQNRKKNYKMEFLNKVVKLMDGTEELMNGEHCSRISMMDGQMAEDVYLLILQHFIENNKGFKQALIDGKELPYSSKPASKDGKGLTVKVSQIPEDLQRIIVRYLRIVSL